MTTLKLKLRYDDACVVYLNGTEVGRRNFNGAPSYNSISVTSRPGGDSSAIVFEDIDLTASRNLLVAGGNLLAIHVINATASFSATNGKDLLLQSRLEAVVPSQIILTQSTQVKARVRDNNGNWSPLTDFNFVVDTVPASAANIVISELNYNPLPPTPAEALASGANNENDFEFIEIKNISTQTVDLTQCSLEGAVGFSWTGAPVNRQTIPAGGRMVVVENAAAFNARYAGKNAVVAGEFTGNLSNGGELLTMRAKNGSIIKSFTYDDVEPWPVDADGNGYTLVLLNPATNPDHTVGRNWRSSAVLSGCPGQADGVPFNGSTADTDGDDVYDVVEFAVGSNPADGAQTRLPVIGYADFDTGAGAQSYLTFGYITDLNTDGVSVNPEVSSNLTNWQAGTISLTYVSTTNNGDGSATTVWRSTLPVSALPARLFARLTALAVP